MEWKRTYLVIFAVIWVFDCMFLVLPFSTGAVLTMLAMMHARQKWTAALMQVPVRICRYMASHNLRITESGTALLLM